MVNITCLIQKDGFDKFVFLHKSIQEFHAAKFIASLPHKHKEKFYLKLVDIIDNEDKFDNVLVFLRYIDADDYNSLLVLNYFNKKKLNHLGSESEDIIINAIIQEILEDKKVLFAIQGDSFICDSMQVLEQKNLLSTLSLFKNKTRRSRPEYEEILSNHLFRLEDKTERNDILNIYPVSASELKEAAKDDITDDKVSIKLSDYLTLNKSIEIYSEIIKKEILAFHEEIYKPIYDKGEQVSRILDIDFDM
ncbi:hypothetical protein [Vibrio fluvialis]|uniref:hypothetical protein n=1 Tax=Vibrio fluvialis TaxID=676 RepID=UPI001268141E|nr:hypothetical protein [Vibrio fluvialis]